MKLSNGNKTSDCVYILCLKVNSIFLKINSKSRKRILMPIIGRVTPYPNCGTPEQGVYTAA